MFANVEVAAVPVATKYVAMKGFVEVAEKKELDTHPTVVKSLFASRQSTDVDVRPVIFKGRPKTACVIDDTGVVVARNCSKGRMLPS